MEASSVKVASETRVGTMPSGLCFMSSGRLEVVPVLVVRLQRVVRRPALLPSQRLYPFPRDVVGMMFQRERRPVREWAEPR